MITTKQKQTNFRWRSRAKFGGNREIVLIRDGYKCVKCGMTGEEHKRLFNETITIDHIDGNGKNSKIPNNSLDNLQTLCCRCHTRKDNLRTMAKKTYCKRGHAFTSENIYTGPNGRRYCYACTKIWRRKHYLKNNGWRERHKSQYSWAIVNDEPAIRSGLTK